MMGEDIVPSKHHWFGFDYRLDNKAATYRRTNQTWRIFYQMIYNVNSIIANIDKAAYDTESQRDYVKGQALAIRAYGYWNLAAAYSFTFAGHQNDLCVPIYTQPTIIGAP